jgi:hypothetical protein
VYVCFVRLNIFQPGKIYYFVIFGILNLIIFFKVLVLEISRFGYKIFLTSLNLSGPGLSTVFV